MHKCMICMMCMTRNDALISCQLPAIVRAFCPTDTIISLITRLSGDANCVIYDVHGHYLWYTYVEYMSHATC